MSGEWTTEAAGRIKDALAAHDAEIAAKALEAMGEFFRMASQLGTGERDEIAAQACFDRAAALRGGQ